MMIRSNKGGGSPQQCIGERLAIHFIVMNGEAYLERNLRRVYRDIARHCLDYRFEYVENDSTDATRDVLRAFESEDPRFRGEMLSLDGVHSEELCLGHTSSNCSRRTDRLAMLRDIALQRCMRWDDATAVLSIDMDFVDYDTRALHSMLHTFAATPDISAIFGMSVFNGLPTRLPPILYDTGAIRPYMSIVPIWWYTCISSHTPTLIPVDSAFSGFGLYRTQALRDVHASYKRNPGSIEHIEFNKSIRGTRAVYSGFRPVYHRGGSCMAFNLVAQYGTLLLIIIIIIIVTIVVVLLMIAPLHRLIRGP